MRRRGLLAVFCALSLGACPDDQAQDPLDPALLIELSEAGGDGRGEALGGRYVTAADVLECDCPPRMGVDLCGPVGAAQLIGINGPARLVQVDGWLTYEPEVAALPWALSGAVNRDRSFALGGISGLAVGLFTVGLYARFDGEFTVDGLHGELAHRLLGELPDGPVDCRTTYAVTGVLAPDT
ncbi:hypothetical protein [Nannocystis punicea]|uniref:Lipoprotein n=1 Tax=Nannocystis punicea TaxID=2995304 RepID=A0ABY7HDG3_9BACT|nr:hypothetical protein [Nannocystis poenicansa]WAS97335.1 hypothetical protein O0S08_14400 [Nannocystis poenicansa]